MPRPKDKDVVNSNTREAVIQREATWLDKVMEKSQAEGKEYYTVLTQQSFDKLHRNRATLRPEFWSDQDEAQVMAQWELDLAELPCRPPNSKEQYLWKTCARFLRCLPTELIGMRYGLEYDTEGASSQNWTEHFCTRLIRIIAHPIFANDPAKIALAIKFSVCSWQRLGWVIPRLGDLFLVLVSEVAERKDQMVGAELVRDSIKEWRSMFPDGELPPWAQLLKALVANSKRPVSAADSPHLVATHHLSAIVDSLDEISHGKLPIYHSVDVYERALKDIRANVDLPVKGETVRQLLADGIIHNRRLKVLRDSHPDAPDLWKHVSQPETTRKRAKGEYADIYGELSDEESEDEETDGAEQPARARRAARRAAPQPGRNRGRPSRAENAQPVEVEDDSNPGDAPEDGGDNPPPVKKRKPGRPRKSEAAAAKNGEAVAAKKPRGRPRKNVEAVQPAAGVATKDPAAEDTAQTPPNEDAAPGPRPNTADSGEGGTPSSVGSDTRLVPASLRRHPGGNLRRRFVPSLPDSTANLAEEQLGQRAEPVDPGFSLGNDDDGLGDFLDDDPGYRNWSPSDTFHANAPLPSVEDSQSRARPTTSHSEELGQATAPFLFHEKDNSAEYSDVGGSEGGAAASEPGARGSRLPSAAADNPVPGIGPGAAPMTQREIPSSPEHELGTNPFAPRAEGRYRSPSQAQPDPESRDWPMGL